MTSDDQLVRLKDAGVPSPKVDLDLLRTAIEDRGLDEAVLASWIDRRVAREPLQLILGSTWFRNVEILCAPGVFIPRPETEVVAGLAIAAAGHARPEPLVVDVCTGSGAIACALVTEVPGVRVIATELGVDAARLAGKNIARAMAGQAGTPVAEGASAIVRSGSLLDPISTEHAGEIDVIVSNPPYLPLADVGSWPPEVAEHEGVLALVGGTHGNEIVEELLESAPRWLKPGGTIILELDPRLASQGASFAQRMGLQDVQIKPDLTGTDRVLVARRSTSDVTVLGGL